ncbi:MAG: Fic family protein [Clostridiales bacterium]|nr:Fic family protein [Clostridiales bacterium]
MNIRDFIEKKGIKISDISKSCNMPYTTLHDGFDNPDSIKATNLKKISDYLGLSMDELYKLLSFKNNSLLSILIDQKKSNLKGNIYHYTQIKFSYNTNRIEGSKLTEEETRYIFETNTLFQDKTIVNVDDIIETANHFYLFDVMLDNADDMLTESMIKKFHGILKNGTEDSRKDWFEIGDYKSLPNEVEGKKTTPPTEVSKEIKKMLNWYQSIPEITLDTILEFHYRFESIHPFHDGNGRIGRIIMFKECLRNSIIPFIIEDELKAFYYRGLSEYTREKGYLNDTCLMMQDKYKIVIDKYVGPLLK